MTAVEWLIQQIDNEDMGEIPMWVYDFCNDALEMEKEQIEKAKKEGYNFATSEAIKEIYKNYKQ